MTRLQARDEIARDEAETAARIAYEVKAEFEREAAERASAKQALVAYLAGNEENKKVRALAAEQQRLEDLEYMRKYEEILDKQQKERLARLEKLQEWQVRLQHFPVSHQLLSCLSHAVDQRWKAVSDGICWGTKQLLWPGEGRSLETAVMGSALVGIRA